EGRKILHMLNYQAKPGEDIKDLEVDITAGAETTDVFYPLSGKDVQHSREGNNLSIKVDPFELYQVLVIEEQGRPRPAVSEGELEIEALKEKRF
ncbi:hypothetical protein ACFLQR_05230, partial [Verrucomicrobiota bacterium]